MIYYRKTLFGRGPKLTAVQDHTGDLCLYLRLVKILLLILVSALQEFLRMPLHGHTILMQPMDGMPQIEERTHPQLMASAGGL